MTDRDYRAMNPELRQMLIEVLTDLLAQPPESFPPAARRKLCSLVDDVAPNEATSNVISLEDVRARLEAQEREDLRRAILERAPYLAEWVSSRSRRTDRDM
jgi:hypothetical protein